MTITKKTVTHMHIIVHVFTHISHLTHTHIHYTYTTTTLTCSTLMSPRALLWLTLHTPVDGALHSEPTCHDKFSLTGTPAVFSSVGNPLTGTLLYDRKLRSELASLEPSRLVNTSFNWITRQCSCQLCHTS